LKAYHFQGNPAKDGANQTMDFFHSLDNSRYAEFKVQYPNGLQIKNIKALGDLDTIFAFANNWLKPKAQTGGEYKSTCSTQVDHIKKNTRDKKHKTKRKQVEGQDKDNKTKPKEEGKGDCKV
jgi:hypothetical protein